MKKDKGGSCPWKNSFLAQNPEISTPRNDTAHDSNNLFIGRRLAELELYILLSKLIPKFQLSTDIQELELSQRTIVTTEKPVKIKMVKREQIW